MINIALYGKPASGKGTQAKMLCDSLELFHINTGNLLREESARKTELGKEISSYIDDGNLVPDEVSTRIVEKKYNEIIRNQKSKYKGFLFDGFPRSIQQAINLDELLESNNDSLNNAFHIDISNDVVHQRLTERAEEGGRIDDQDPEKINNRIEHYNIESSDILNYYNNKMKLEYIDGEEDAIDVFSNIVSKINN